MLLLLIVFKWTLSGDIKVWFTPLQEFDLLEGKHEKSIKILYSDRKLNIKFYANVQLYQV